MMSRPVLDGREEAIIRGVQPEASVVSGSKVLREERSLIIGRWAKAQAQCRGRRSSGSRSWERRELAERRASIAWTRWVC